MSDELFQDDSHADLDGMRDLARALKDDARDLGNVTSGMRSAVVSMDFEGPAADRFEHRTRSAFKDLRELADRLDALVRLLLDTEERVRRERERRLGQGTWAELVPEDTASWGVR